MPYSENELISELKKANNKAFDVLVKEYSRPVYYLVYRILHIGHSKEDIEECVSDVFVEVWNKIDTFDVKRGNFKTWVFMLAKYTALGYKRKLEKQPIISLAEQDLTATENTEEEVLGLETQQLILEMINTFNEVDRQLFFRRYFLGEDIADLMERFQLSRSAVDNRLLRGRNKIKEVISHDGTRISSNDITD